MNSKAEAIDWLKFAPFETNAEVDVRQDFEVEDFALLDPAGESRAAEEPLLAQTAAKK